jgi:phosphoribosylamine---glycine ligase
VNLLLIDQGSNFLDFALRCLAAGHHVKLFIAPGKNNERLKVADGLVPKIYDFKPWMRWADLIICSDNVKYIDALETYRKYGYPIIGSPKEGVSWELNRTIGQKVLKDAGQSIMDYKTFTDYDTAEAYVKKTQKRFVSKPSGDADKALSYVSRSPRDMIFMLRKWKKLGKIKAPFILQEFCPGIEIAIGGWFGKNGWNSKFLLNAEHKKMLNDDLGCNTGEQGTVMQYVEKDPLIDTLLVPVSQPLLDMGYTGYIDAAAMISPTGDINFLEWTMRCGWPCFQIQQALHMGDPVEWMGDLLEGYDTLETKDEVATGVVVSHADFPFNRKPPEETHGYPIYCDQGPNIHPADVMLGQVPDDRGINQPGWVTAGTYALVATGVAETVSGSARRAYTTVKGIELPNSPGYRTDIGKRLQKELPELHKHGFAKRMNY